MRGPDDQRPFEELDETDKLLVHLRASNTWLNDGKCCGQVDSAGVCFAPACVRGEALKWLFAAADEIERLQIECFALAAGVCEHRVGNEHGNPTCAATGQLIEQMEAKGPWVAPSR